VFELTAENIVNAANILGLKLTRGRLGHSTKEACARAVIRKAVFGDEGRMYGDMLPTALGVSESDLDALEMGFEDWEGCEGTVSNPYFTVGQEVARMAGLPPR
jgi:hypothetical protein